MIIYHQNNIAGFVGKHVWYWSLQPIIQSHIRIAVTNIKVHRSVTLITNLAVIDGSTFRVRIQQIIGTEAPILVADASSFNINK